MGLAGTLALLYPRGRLRRPDAFTFAAWDGKTDSNLATVSLTLSDVGGIFGDGFETASTVRWNATAP